MKIKHFGNCLLIFTLAFLFLVPSFYPVNAQDAGSCQCPARQTLQSGITTRDLCVSDLACGEIIAGQGSWNNGSCVCNVGFLARTDIGVGEGRCVDFGCIRIGPGAWVAQAPAGAADGAETPPPVQQLTNPLGAGADIPEIIARVIKAVLGIVGSIGLLMFIYGGFLWMTAGGNEERVKKGREVLVWATLGLLVIFSAYAILNFVIGALTRSAG